MALGTVGMARICSLVGIAKGTFYAAKDPRDRLTDKHAGLRRHADNIIRRHGAYGIRRIHQALKDKGTHIGRDTLGTLLTLWGLSLKRKVKPRTVGMIERILTMLRDKSNLLGRMTLTRPLQAVTSDITELWYAGGTLKCYLCVHKDAFGQCVYGWSIAPHMEASLVLDSFKRACAYLIAQIGSIPSGLVFHQDRGSQYTSYAYVEKALTVGKLSYSSPGTPTDNPGQESFFGRFKDEWRGEIAELRNMKEVERFIRAKLHYYSHQRLHTSIGYRTPIAFTKSVLTSWGK